MKAATAWDASGLAGASRLPAGAAKRTDEGVLSVDIGHSPWVLEPPCRRLI